MYLFVCLLLLLLLVVVVVDDARGEGREWGVGGASSVTLEPTAAVSEMHVGAGCVTTATAYMYLCSSEREWTSLAVTTRLVDMDNDRYYIAVRPYLFTEYSLFYIG